MNRRPNIRHCSGFSLVELLVATALAAAVITTAVMIYQNLTASGGLRPSYGTVTVGAPLANFYGGTATTISAYFAPSYGRAAQAEVVRQQFIDDLQHASAVYCLGRSGVNTLRPTSISVSASLRGDSLDTPDAFRQLIDPTATTFTAYSGASTARNASIFILVPSATPAAATATEPAVLPTLSVLAVYDIDLTPTTSPAGTYASVIRHVGNTLTDYYDVFYPASAGIFAFNPLVVCFGRAGGASSDPLKLAAERPFYFVWWPDPAAHALEAFSSATTGGAGDPRSAYAAMGGRTAFFFVVPMFPAM
ncbi:MAG: prepilin-type N-terminal cleavage/methylation domain-containing protein [Terrimicrobiaceae bacterium]|nr:prepilin-type N-terminal cleavage/methylation domain-containing protein [Terrimicrobiaceae bacterium]